MVANRTRTNDPAMHKDVAARVHIKINPPKSMSRHAKKHFREIIGRRANLDWNEHDISTAVVLAEMMALCQQQQVILARELEENPEEDPNPQRLKLISESSFQDYSIPADAQYPPSRWRASGTSGSPATRSQYQNTERGTARPQPSRPIRLAG